QHADQRSRRDPVPVLFLDVRPEVVDEGKGEGDEANRQDGLNNTPYQDGDVCQSEIVANRLRDVAAKENDNQGEQGESGKNDGEADRDSLGLVIRPALLNFV